MRQLNKKKILEKRDFGLAAVVMGIALLFCPMPALGQEAPSGNVSAANSTVDMLFMLLQIQADVQGRLNDLDSDRSL